MKWSCGNTHFLPLGEGEAPKICKPCALTRRALIRRGFAAPKRAGLSQRERYQNTSLSASWICREVVDVAVISPAESLRL